MIIFLLFSLLEQENNTSMKQVEIGNSNILESQTDILDKCQNEDDQKNDVTNFDNSSKIHQSQNYGNQNPKHLSQTKMIPFSYESEFYKCKSNMWFNFFL